MPENGTMQRITIMGATGSVGRAVIDVIERHREHFDVVAVVGGRDATALADVARRLDASFAAVAAEGAGSALREALAGSGVESGAGATAVNEAVDRDCDIVVAAIAGAAGLASTHRALRAGRKLALANKETLVCAGAAFMRDAHRHGVQVLPLDSEHNALWQALGKAQPDEVEAMILTASGGPFRTWPAEAIAHATREQAVRHPNYAMGAKISVDSASMMNKGLEVIEAFHLFGIEPARLKVLVHPQQIVHGLVAFCDGSMTAGMAAPDMRIPAAHCLGVDARLKTGLPRLDLAAIARLDFSEPDEVRFPALRLALDALAAGGGMPTVLNAANEIAVEAFLAGRIAFGAISGLVRDACEGLAAMAGAAPASVAEALALDAEVRSWTHARLALDRGLPRIKTYG